MTRRVLVRVPASSSNLGGGFDCVGTAVDRWLIASVHLDHRLGAPVIEREGTLAALSVAPEDDRLVLGFRAACAAAGRDAGARVRVRAGSRIPVARGLGSSAAATVAGAAAANVLLELGLDDGALARACAAVEGHPDNVVPAIFGGTRLAVTTDDLHVAELRVDSSIALVFAVPDFEVETARARRILPENLPHARATRAAALGAALVQGLATANGALLAAALDDVLHVPFRRPLVRGFDAVVRAAKGAGAYGATLSGSGSAIIALTPAPRAVAVAAAMRAAWQLLDVRAECFQNPPYVAGYTATIYHDREDAALAPPPSREVAVA